MSPRAFRSSKSDWSTVTFQVCPTDPTPGPDIGQNGRVVAPSPPAELDEHRVPLTPARLVLRLVVGAVVAASFAVWFYAYSGAADRPPPDELDSTALLLAAENDGTDYLEMAGEPAFGKRAELICQSATDSLPNARFAESQTERATQIRVSNVILRDMVAELRSLPVATDRDNTLRSLWLDDWSVLLADRDRYANNVETDPGAIFTLTAVEGEERLERRLTRFARTNLMLPCGAPTDLG